MEEVNLISGIDFLLLPFYLIIIFFIARSIKNRHIVDEPYYKYYIPGLFMRILGGIIFCLVYVFHYKGGDTTNYFSGGLAVYNLAFYNFEGFFHTLVFGVSKGTIYHFFDFKQGVPPYYMMKDPETFFVIRFITPLVFISAKSYLISTVFMAWLAHSGIWRLFMVFIHYFPKYHKVLAFAVIFFPSVVFWGSGIIKDSITLSAAGWYTYAFFMVFIKKEKIKRNILYIIVSSYLIISIKPFIFIALMPGSIIWLMFSQIKNIKNKIIKSLIAPALIVVFTLIGALILSSMSGAFGYYSDIDSILERAVVVQQDLIREEAYGSRFYNIGDFEPTLAGILPKLPVAINAGLFRPYLWESQNFMMVLSGLENFLILILVLYSFLRVGIFKFFKIIFDEPILLFSFTFALFFSFSIGLTSANFGALVRYKITLLPFFVATLFVTLKKVQEIYKEKKMEQKQDGISKSGFS